VLILFALITHEYHNARLINVMSTALHLSQHVRRPS